MKFLNVPQINVTIKYIVRKHEPKKWDIVSNENKIRKSLNSLTELISMQKSLGSPCRLSNFSILCLVNCSVFLFHGITLTGVYFKNSTIGFYFCFIQCYILVSNV